MEAILPKARRSINWFFWTIIILIGAYYAYYFFVSFSVRERYLLKAGKNDLETMINSIKSRETYYLNLVSSWSEASNCQYFHHELGMDFYECAEDIGTYDRVGEDLFMGHTNFYIKIHEDVNERSQRLKGKQTTQQDTLKRIYVKTSEFFDGLIYDNAIFSDYNISYTKNDDDKREHQILYSSSPFNWESDLDAISDTAIVANVYVHDMQVAGVERKAFISKFRIRGDEYTINGLIDTNQWLSEKRYFNFSSSVFFAGFILLIILFIPHLRLINLGFYDRLGNKNIVRTFSSFILIFPVVLLVSNNFFFSNKIKSHQKQELDSLSNNISQTIIHHVEDLVKTEGAHYGEYFLLDHEGRIGEIKYFNGQRYIDGDLRSNLEGNNLSHRKYFQNAQEEDCFSHLEILRSVTSNKDFEINLAVELIGTDSIDVRNNSPAEDISAIIEEQDLKGFFYQLINEEGRLLFDSRKAKSGNIGGNVYNRFDEYGPINRELMQFLISPENGNQPSKSLSTNYENRNVISKVTPLNFSSINNLSKPIVPVENYFLITSISLEPKVAFLSGNLTLVSALLVSFIAFIYLMWLVFARLTKKPTVLLRRHFSLPWLMPQSNKRFSYYFLIAFAFFQVAIISLLVLTVRPNLYVLLTVLVISNIIYALGAFKVLTGEEDRYQKIMSRLRFIGSGAKAYGVFLAMWFAVIVFVPSSLIVYITKLNDLRHFDRLHSSSKEVFFDLRTRLGLYDTSSSMNGADDLDADHFYEGFLGFLTTDILFLGLFVLFFMVLIYFAQSYIFSKILLLQKKKAVHSNSPKNEALHAEIIEEEFEFLKQFKPELSKTDFEQEIYDIFNDHFQDETKAENVKYKMSESLILIIQDNYEQEYEKIWSQLTSEEKFLIFDMAEDGCMNAKNIYLVKRLCRKGVLAFTGHGFNHLQLKSRVFQNFILMVSDTDAELLEQIQISKKGKWGMNNTLILVGALVLFLISFAIHEFVIEKILAVATGLFAILPGITGYFSKLNWRSILGKEE